PPIASSGQWCGSSISPPRSENGQYPGQGRRSYLVDLLQNLIGESAATGAFVVVDVDVGFLGECLALPPLSDESEQLAIALGGARGCAAEQPGDLRDEAGCLAQNSLRVRALIAAGRDACRRI